MMVKPGDKRKKAQSGFSLLEVLISLTVLSIGLLALISLFGSGYMKLRGGDNRTVAARLAQDRMESLRHSKPRLSPCRQEIQDRMTIEWCIVPSADPNLWLISVDVSWLGPDQNLEKVALKSFRSI